LAIEEPKQKATSLFRDFHLFLQDPNPVLVRQLKDVLQPAVSPRPFFLFNSG
jgi:hypothetical protein